MSKLYLGGTEIKHLYLGSTEIKKLYLGSTLLFDNSGATTPVVFDEGGQTPGQTPGGPMLQYVPSLDRIYHTWNGPNAEPQIMQFTISTGLWSQPYVVGVTADHHENHNVPALLRLPSGRLLVIHGANSGTPVVRRTTSPDDITAWEDTASVPSTSAIYPYLFNYNNIPQLILRTGPYIQHHMNTLDEGDTWNEVTALINGESPYWSWINEVTLDGDVVHIGGLISRGGRPRFDMWHAIYDLTDGSIRNTDGTHTLAFGSLPLTKTLIEANDYLLDTASVDETLDTSGAYGVGGVRWDLDASGDLHMVYVKRDNPLVAGDGITRLYYNRTTGGADGGSWGTPVELRQRGDALSGDGALKGDVSIRVRADGKIDVYDINVTVFTQTGSHYEGSGAVDWIHHNGTSWQAPVELMAEDEYSEINNPYVYKELPDDAKFHFRAGTVAGNDTSSTKAFLFGGATVPARVEFPTPFGTATAGTPANLAPQLLNAIPNQPAAAGTPFSYVIPADTFYDPNLDALTLTVTQADDSPLPAWLSFDDVDTLSGTPAGGDAGTLSLKVTASDGTLTVSDTFDVTVSAAFDPATLSLDIWLEMDSGNLVGDTGTFSGDMTDETAVTTALTGTERCDQWTDQSGNGNHFVQATDGNRPLWVTDAENDFSKAALNFVGATGHVLAGPSVPAAAGVSFAAVIETAATTSTRMLFATENSANDRFWITIASGAFCGAVYNGASTGGKSGVPTVNTRYILQYLWDGATPHLYLNGVEQAGTVQNTTTPSTAGAAYVGARTGTASNPFTGPVAAVFVRSGTPWDDTERQAIDAYLATKYGVILP